jgi:PEP-CTERM motif
MQHLSQSFMLTGGLDASTFHANRANSEGQMRLLKCAVVLFATFAFATLFANASPMDQFSGSINTSFEVNSFSFVLPAMPTDIFLNPMSSGGFDISNVPVDFDGTTSDGLLEFFDDNAGGGFNFFSNTVELELFGPQLYTGSESAPTFLPGDFYLSEGGPIAYWTLEISAAPGAVTPEPSTLVLLATGLVSVWGGRRRGFF